MFNILLSQITLNKINDICSNRIKMRFNPQMMFTSFKFLYVEDNMISNIKIKMFTSASLIYIK